MSLGKKIKEERIKNNLSQRQLGALLNVTQQAIGKWEKDLSEPDITALKLMADCFKISLDYFFERNFKIYDNISEEDYELLEMFHKLSPQNEELLLKSFYILLKPNERTKYKLLKNIR